jgi:hypothetical protein
MTLPEFTAETSLYRTRVDYRSHRAAVRLASAVPQLVDPPGTVCGPCMGFGWQVCHNCRIEPARCIFWVQQCHRVLR